MANSAVHCQGAVYMCNDCIFDYVGYVSHVYPCFVWLWYILQWLWSHLPGNVWYNSRCSQSTSSVFIWRCHMMVVAAAPADLRWRVDSTDQPPLTFTQFAHQNCSQWALLVFNYEPNWVLVLDLCFVCLTVRPLWSYNRAIWASWGHSNGPLKCGVERSLW